MSWVTIFHLMRDISCNKTTQKYNPLINAFTLPVNENHRVVRPIGPKIKGVICGLIISTALCRFIISHVYISQYSVLKSLLVIYHNFVYGKVSH